MLVSFTMAFRASEFAVDGEREKVTHFSREKKGRERGEIKVVLGISEENTPVTSKAERLLKDGYNRLTP